MRHLVAVVALFLVLFGATHTAVAATPEASIRVEEMDATFVALKTSNVRAEPTTESDRVGRLSRDDAVAVTGKVKDRNWYRIEHEGGTAYVFGTLIKEVDPGELAAWETVVNSSEATDFETFLGTYSNGHFAGRARVRRDELATPPPSTATNPVDLAFWQAVKDSADPKDLNAYLTHFPNGAFAVLARNRLEKLKEKRAAIVTPPPSPPAPAPAGTSVEPAVGVYPKTYDPGDTFKDCDACPEMVVVPAGQFMMGSPSTEEGRYSAEGPVHRVQVPTFALGKFEVTRGQFTAFAMDTGHSPVGGCYVDRGGYDWARLASKNWRDPNFSQTDRDPVVCVNWKDANAYVEWLGRKTGERYRLPSESEWEYAARAGTTAARYWGNDPDAACTNANVADRSTKQTYSYWTIHNCRDGNVYTAPVGSFRANGFGLYDMLGNVWEWVEDCWNRSYYDSPSDGSAWTRGECGWRVLRGGSWAMGPGNVRSAFRGTYKTGFWGISFGFRVARTLP